MAVTELVVLEHKVATLALPVERIEENVDSTLDALLRSMNRLRASWEVLGQVDERWVGWSIDVSNILAHPLAHHHVVAPITVSELCGRQILLQGAR